MTGEVAGDLTGRRLGNYRIDGVLGKGGMSVTYKATDVRLGRKVALKIIGDHLGADPEFRERFVDEARNTSAIDHANVVPLYDFGEIDGMLYIAMRMVDGGDLADLIFHGSIAPVRSLSLLDQVADALDTLHNRGLVHLDVKPANVLVTSRETAREHVYLADFGLTRRGATGHRTRGGDFLGSPTYAAPEHLRGEPLDGRTDQYALTCVLFACLTGAPPFKGDVPTVIKGHLNGEPPSISQVMTVPGAIDDVVRKGLAKSPKDRYANCVELIVAARRALGQQAMSDKPLARRDTAAAVGAQQASPAPEEGFSGQAPEARRQQLPSGYGHQEPGHGQGYPRGSQADYRPSPGPHQGPPPGPPAGYRPPTAEPSYRLSGSPYGTGTSSYGGRSPQGLRHGFPIPPPPGYGPADGPVRLRPPAPASSSASFSESRNRGRRWLWIVLGGVLAAAAVFGAILIFGDSGTGVGTPPQTTTAPEIPVGPDNGGSSAAKPSSSAKAPPTSIPIKPSP